MFRESCVIIPPVDGGDGWFHDDKGSRLELSSDTHIGNGNSPRSKDLGLIAAIARGKWLVDSAVLPDHDRHV